jgi:acetyl esterase/lipase
MTFDPAPGRRRLFGAAAAGLLAGCSPIRVISGLTPSHTYRRTAGLTYGRGARQVLDVYRPAISTSAAPVIVFFYGGNWNSGNRADYLFVGEALAARGCVVVIPDYRLYPDVRFPDFLADCAAATAWTAANIAAYGGNPRRLFLMGHSAGAYNAAMLAFDGRYLEGARVERNTLRGFIGLAGPYDFLPLQGPVTKEVFGFPYTPVTTQPIHFVSADAPPSLLMTGSADTTVDPGNSARLAARLRSAGVPVREVVYPGAGHMTIVGALATPLRLVTPPALDDVVAFVNERARL